MSAQGGDAQGRLLAVLLAATGSGRCEDIARLLTPGRRADGRAFGAHRGVALAI